METSTALLLTLRACACAKVQSTALSGNSFFGIGSNRKKESLRFGIARSAFMTAPCALVPLSPLLVGRISVGPGISSPYSPLLAGRWSEEMPVDLCFILYQHTSCHEREQNRATSSRNRECSGRISSVRYARYPETPYAHWRGIEGLGALALSQLSMAIVRLF